MTLTDQTQGCRAPRCFIVLPRFFVFKYFLLSERCAVHTSHTYKQFCTKNVALTLLAIEGTAVTRRCSNLLFTPNKKQRCGSTGWTEVLIGNRTHVREVELRA